MTFDINMNLNRQKQIIMVDVGYNTMNFVQMKNRIHRKKNVDEELQKLNHQISTIRKARNF